MPATLAPDQCRSLLEDLAQIPDPHHRRGRRHALGAVQAVAVAAVLTGARSLAAIGEWAADAPQPVLAALGARCDPLRRVWEPPGEATVRRVLARIDPDAMDQVIGRWLTDQQPPPPTTRPSPATQPAWRRAVASTARPCAVAAITAGRRCTCWPRWTTPPAVLAQTDVDTTTNEIVRFQPLLERLELTATVVTADALHTQREHAEWLVTVKQAAYLLIVKANQPALHHQLKALPWREVRVADHTRGRGHHRMELRRLQVITVAGLDFPHATQAIRITRRVRSLHSRRWRTVTVYAVTSLTAAQASPARLADWLRGHWASRRCTTSATPPSPRTPPRSAPPPHPGPWPACATSPSASCASAATATSPQPCAATPATPPDPSHSHHQPMNQTLRHFAEA